VLAELGVGTYLDGLGNAGGLGQIERGEKPKMHP